MSRSTQAMVKAHVDSFGPMATSKRSDGPSRISISFMLLDAGLGSLQDGNFGAMGYSPHKPIEATLLRVAFIEWHSDLHPALDIDRTV